MLYPIPLSSPHSFYRINSDFSSPYNYLCGPYPCERIKASPQVHCIWTTVPMGNETTMASWLLHATNGAGTQEHKESHAAEIDDDHGGECDCIKDCGHGVIVECRGGLVVLPPVGLPLCISATLSIHLCLMVATSHSRTHHIFASHLDFICHAFNRLWYYKYPRIHQFWQSWDDQWSMHHW